MCRLRALSRRSAAATLPPRASGPSHTLDNTHDKTHEKPLKTVVYPLQPSQTSLQSLTRLVHHASPPLHTVPPKVLIKFAAGPTPCRPRRFNVCAVPSAWRRWRGGYRVQSGLAASFILLVSPRLRGDGWLGDGGVEIFMSGTWARNGAGIRDA